MVAIENPRLSLTSTISGFVHDSRGSTRSEADHVHRLPYRIGILARVAVDGTQNSLHSGGQQALRRNDVLRGDDVMVESDPESHLGQVGVTADGLDELVASTWDGRISDGCLLV